jgi:predicted transcriptional regulator
MSAAIKDALRELADQLPDECTWDDVMYQVYVRQKIQAGLDDLAAGRVLDDDEVFAEFDDGQNPMDSDRT